MMYSHLWFKASIHDYVEVLKDSYYPPSVHVLGINVVHEAVIHKEVIRRSLYSISAENIRHTIETYA